ncbi:hypothetical protein CDD81_2655 [Ophiocordyceps australis]|uniref:Homeobox domain-containing protein n=1 Tax=Ophiocordyceps australis TaxID=1399860 RepID=A0A2C5X7I0_9HYPO|nr:hypothetical protein CDD81_2655 [Ophiocordyceps australis]
MGPFSQHDWTPWACAGLGDSFSPMAYSHINTYHHGAYMTDSVELEPYQAHHNRHLLTPQHPHHPMTRATESKPRLSKEEVEVLEAEFQKNHKPSSSVKKALAESMRVDNARINNWFQNRRAREKKENNIRVYEAKQRLEKDKAEAESGQQKADSNKECDLVASSAPFPEPCLSLAARSAETSPSLSGQTPPGIHNDAASYESDSQTPGGDTCSASPAPRMPADDGPNTPKYSNQAEGESASCNGFVSGHLSAQADSAYYCLTDASLGVSSVLSPAKARPSSEFLKNYPQQYLGDQGLEQVFAESSEAALSRSRRPAPLTIAGCRPPSSSHTPRCASDGERRGDRISPIRRVSSSTSRVSKVMATPRSPFYDGKVADLVGLASGHSPVNVGAPGPVTTTTTTQAPPTPDTPMTLHHNHGNAFQQQAQQLMDGGISLSYPIDCGNIISTDLALQDPTLRTPPTTPGFMDSLFSGMASTPTAMSYDLSAPDEALSPSGLGRLAGSFNMSAAMVAGASIPTSFVGDATARHGTTLLPSQMEPSYFGGYLSSTAEYNWADASV